MAKKENIKILVSNEKVSNSSCAFVKIIEVDSIKKKFRITNSVGNCYCNSTIEVMLPTLEWAGVAVDFTFNAPHISYLENEATKRAKMEQIYQKAIDFIIKVYC